VSPILESIGSVKGFGWGSFSLPSSFESIASATGTGSSGTINFNSIPGTYKHLQLRFLGNTTSSGDTVAIRLNVDTGSNYVHHSLAGNGTTVSATGNTGISAATIFVKRYGTVATYPTAGILDILDYTSTSKYKTLRSMSGADANGSGNFDLTSGLWLSTSAITDIRIVAGSSNFTSDSSFALYGIKG
jgi:hypothetical protein